MRSDNGTPVNITPRQLDILTLMGDGLRRERIAAELGLKLGTVSSAMSSIYLALHVHRADRAVEAARSLGLIPAMPAEAGARAGAVR